MSFVSRLFSNSSSTAVAEVNIERPPNINTNSNGAPVKVNSPQQPNGSILRQPSPPGKKQRQKERRVSFSNAPVKVTTIPANPMRVSRSITNPPAPRPVQSTQSTENTDNPQPANNNGSNSWFRSLFGSSKSSTPTVNSSPLPSPQQTTDDTPAAKPSPYESFRPLNNSQLLESIPLELTQNFDGKQLRLAWCKQQKVESHNEPEAALDAVENIELISSQEQPENLNSSGNIRLFILNNSTKKLFSIILDFSPVPHNQFVQAKPFKLEPHKVGLLMFNRDGFCGLNTTQSTPLELTLKKLLVENIMEEVPTPKTTNPLLRTRARKPSTTKDPLPAEIPSTVTSPLTAESRAQTNKARLEGVDLNKLGIDVFYSTLSEMIFGAISIAQKPVKSMIDTQFANGVKLLSFKLHHLGTDWHDEKSSDSDKKDAEDLFISSFIIDLKNGNVCFVYVYLAKLVSFLANPRITELQIQVGVAILWLVPHSSPAFSKIPSEMPSECSPISSELTLYNLLFNTPGFLMHTLQTFAHDLFTLGISNIRTCFHWMLYRITDFMNALRLSCELDEDETIDLLVNLIQRYDNKEHSFFTSKLLSTILSFSYKQDRFKVALWTSKPEQLPMMCQVATLINQFMVKSVHRVSDEMIITDDYRFVIPETLNTEYEKESSELAADANFDSELFQPVAGSSCSSTLSTVTAIQVYANSNAIHSNDNQQHHSSFISESQPSGLRNRRYCPNSKSDRKSRDESIGYESLTESAISGNVSPANSDEIYDDDEDENSSNENVKSLMQKENDQIQKQQKDKQSDDLRAQLNVSQTTDYNEDESAIARSDTDASSEENSRTAEFVKTKYSSSYNSSFSLTKARQSNYFRGYVDLRYKDGQPNERENGGSKAQELSSSNQSGEQPPSSVISISGTFSPQTHSDSDMKTDQSDSNTQKSPLSHNLNDTKPLLPLSISSFQTSQTSVSPVSSSKEATQSTHFSESPSTESHSPSLDANAQNTTTRQVIEIRQTPFNTIELKKATPKKKPSPLEVSLPASPFGNLSKAASTFYHYSWLSLPVITTQHLDLLTTQIILGETLDQSTKRQRDIEKDGYPETYEYLYERMENKLKDEESNDTILLINCDFLSMHLLERTLNSDEVFGPVKSTYMANACERIVSLATIENRKYDVWQYLRYTLTHLMLKSEVLESVLTNDLHLLMTNHTVTTSNRIDEKMKQEIVDIYIDEKTRAYAKRIWSELIGDQTLGVYLTCDGPKAAFDLFGFRPPTSALYLFSNTNLNHFYLPSNVTTRLLDFDSSDVPLIVGMRKLFLRSREPLITSIHGRENAKTIDYLLKVPQFTRNEPFYSFYANYDIYIKRHNPVYKTLKFNVLIEEEPTEKEYKPALETTTLSEKNNKS